MLDLNKLVRMLDEALAKETPDSWNRKYNEYVRQNSEDFLEDDVLPMTGPECYETPIELECAEYHAKTENKSYAQTE
jgi:hypothetical protein